MSEVTLRREGDIAIVMISNPPVNAASKAVRAGLASAIEQVDASDAAAAVLICDGRTFVAGADVREFNLPPMEPHLPDVVTNLENARVPWVAAIHGSALGGGLEIALGCSARVAAPSAKLGLPEVNLGLIPGAGGTVRMPRLVPVTDAIDMITSGKPVSAQKAKDLGLIEEVAGGDLLESAIALAHRLKTEAKPATLSAREAASHPSDEEWASLEARISKRARGQKSPVEALQAVRNAVSKSAADALSDERETFFRLKSDPQSAALRHIFFAERSATRLDRLKGVSPRAFSKIGIIGGGTMGAGIASAALLSGLSVTMIERDAEAAATGRSRVLATLDGSLKRGLISAEKRQAMEAAFAASASYADLSDADLIIEAVFEDMDVKKAVFAELDKVAREDAILASNTSYLDVGEIAGSTKDPSRVIGLHFFSPAHIMKLLEVIHHPAAADDVLATGFALGKTMRKITVPAGVCDGFIANRIMSAYRDEGDYMLEDGALPWQIDAAMNAFGFPMGLYEMQDMAGLEIGWANRKRQAATRDPNKRYVDIGDRICEQGHYGKKTGQGWYLYQDGKPLPNPEVEAMIVEASKAKGIERQTFTNEMIMDRILKVIQQEGEKILAEGIAASPEAIDVAMVNGFSFPRWRGGPMFMAKS